ncbi:shootin-1-like [Oncorhynchus kisutch]|uniref:shootin-1-like n=1 Tax=Oncorhynchus kisutch TaxID=8019 RepID=UPI0012DC20AC|nr:shootin-1-like [Oncorhynchus kisutch]
MPQQIEAVLRAKGSSGRPAQAAVDDLHRQQWTICTGSSGRHAQSAVDDSEKIFTELIHSIERRHSEVKELIRAQEKDEVSQAEGLLEQLEQEVTELRRRCAEMEQFSHTEDNILFLQRFKDHSTPPPPPPPPPLCLKSYLPPSLTKVGF